jgi:hypothetical protein
VRFPLRHTVPKGWLTARRGRPKLGYERSDHQRATAQQPHLPQDAGAGATCETVVVNGHGGLLILKHEIDNGEMLVITNPETLEDQECRVVFLGELGDRGQRVGVEFLTPAPRFWGLEFNEPPPSGSSNVQ